MSSIITLALVIAAGCLLYGVWRDRQSNGQRRSASWAGSKKMSRPLLQAVKGDQALATRLIEGAKLKYPGKSDRWYVEKVIYDIERDGAGTSFSNR